MKGSSLLRNSLKLQLSSLCSCTCYNKNRSSVFSVFSLTNIISPAPRRWHNCVISTIECRQWDMTEVWDKNCLSLGPIPSVLHSSCPLSPPSYLHGSGGSGVPKVLGALGNWHDFYSGIMSTKETSLTKKRILEGSEFIARQQEAWG